MTRIIIVNELDEEIGLKERSAIAAEDIYRVSALWVENSHGDILLAQRSLSKAKSPGKWGPAAAGTVDEGESYELNIIKEAEEEIGLKLTPGDLTLGPKIRMQGMHVHFTQWFYAIVDKPIGEFILQKEEVMGLRWISRDDFLRELESSPDLLIATHPQWLPQILEKVIHTPIDTKTGGI